MVDKIIIAVIIFIAFANLILIMRGSTNEYDKQLEDEEQVKWLKEYYEQRR